MPSEVTAPLTFILLFDTLPEVVPNQLKNHLALFGPFQSPLRVSQHLAQEGYLYAVVDFDHHQFRLVGFSLPAPDDAVKLSIDSSHWSRTDKAPLYAHRSHVLCYYQGRATDATEQMIAMTIFVSAFSNRGMVGVVDPDAWNCLPTSVLLETLTPAILAAHRMTVPLGLWTGFVKFIVDEDAVWFCTKGCHRWGICDFAFLGSPDQFEEVFILFNVLFHYAQDHQVLLEVGSTVSLGRDRLLKLTAVTEYAEYLEGPMGTLVVQHVSRLEIH